MGISFRIDQLLADRTASHFVERYGLNKNWVQFLRNEKGTYKLIWPLVLCENISADWLLSGHGQPYRVNHWFDASKMSDAVIELLEDNQSNVFLLGGDGLLIWKRAFLEWKEGQITEFIQYEVHFGPFNERLINRLKQPLIMVQDPALELGAIKQIKSGEAGTYNIFGNLHDPGGLISLRETYRSLAPEDIDEIMQARETAPGPVELDMVLQYRDLTEARQKLVLDILASYSVEKDEH